jgi:hypothetical protein
MAEFVKERGEDSAPPPIAQKVRTDPNPMIRMITISSLASLVGWVTGAVVTTVFRSRRARKNKL